MTKAAKKETPKNAKTVPVKLKNPKPDYTPKNQDKPKPKQKEVVEKPPLMYWGEGSFTVQEDGAGCTWNQASRQLALDAALDFITTYTPAARGLIYQFAEGCSCVPTWQDINHEEWRVFNQVMTKGSHMKRQRFWKFVSYIGKGKIPPDLTLRLASSPFTYSGAERAIIMGDLIEKIKQESKDLMQAGVRADTLLRWHCTVLNFKEYLVESQVAPYSYDPLVDKGYKSVTDWSTHP
jgi:hypothetical protein